MIEFLQSDLLESSRFLNLNEPGRRREFILRLIEEPA